MKKILFLLLFSMLFLGLLFGQNLNDDEDGESSLARVWGEVYYLGATGAMHPLPNAQVKITFNTHGVYENTIVLTNGFGRYELYYQNIHPIKSSVNVSCSGKHVTAPLTPPDTRIDIMVGELPPPHTYD